ncbi:MAG: hypothetical protein LBK25_08250, partial [Treponema sp.]|nr:hypothetical protein [Treponema sp.]
VGKQLPAAVDALYPDYTLYGITDTAYGYLTRGCPRQCGFCIVGEKEGTQARQLYKLEQFWRGQPHIKLLDPNITAAANCVDLLSELAATGAEVDFTQGLDLRLLTDEKLAALSRVRTRVVHFAWDEPAEEGVICERLGAYIRATGAPYERICVYVLVNYNTSFAEDLHRIYRIRDIGANPYVMIYKKETVAREYRNLQRWCNNRRIFRSVSHFEEYSPSKRKDDRWSTLPEMSEVDT